MTTMQQLKKASHWSRTFPDHQQENMVEKLWETMQFGLVWLLKAKSGGNSWCPYTIQYLGRQLAILKLSDLTDTVRKQRKENIQKQKVTKD